MSGWKRWSGVFSGSGFRDGVACSVVEGSKTENSRSVPGTVVLLKEICLMYFWNEGGSKGREGERLFIDTGGP